MISAANGFDFVCDDHAAVIYLTTRRFGREDLHHARHPGF